MRIELVYDRDCPNVAAARANLAAACAAAGVPARWREWERAAAPPRVLGFGSPAVLVDGRDVAGAAPRGGACCRLYGSGAGAPPAELIATAIVAAQPGRNNRTHEEVTP